jgi:hypothetical protein
MYRNIDVIKLKILRVNQIKNYQALKQSDKREKICKPSEN